MSALGHKRTPCDAEAMSALPPIATAKADLQEDVSVLPHACDAPIALAPVTSTFSDRPLPRDDVRFATGSEHARRNQ